MIVALKPVFVVQSLNYIDKFVKMMRFRRKKWQLVKKLKKVLDGKL
jgi:hypothetical protein